MGCAHTGTNAVNGPRYAARCRWLRLTFDEGSSGDLTNRCMHIAREGLRCVGPFLDETETTCGLWEPKTGEGQAT